MLELDVTSCAGFMRGRRGELRMNEEIENENDNGNGNVNEMR